MDFDNESSETPATAAERLLLLLKTRGPQGAAALGTALGTTGEAARQQLAKLAESGLVESAPQRVGVGRPVQLWSLTAAGHARFPDGHAEMVVGLIAGIRRELGDAALDRLVAAREAETFTRYTGALADVATLRDRVAALTGLRSREGYMAGWEEDENGFLLVENHCPICAAATACQGFCRSELDLFRRVLGPEARVERTEHIQTGARRCAYRILPQPDRPEREHDHGV
jgi:predicted ArsR family transcriptional regulator